MEKKITSLKCYLQDGLSLNVEHEALDSLHRFHIDQKHIVYIPHDVIIDKSLDGILELLDVHDVVSKIQAAAAPI